MLCFVGIEVVKLFSNRLLKRAYDVLRNMLKCLYAMPHSTYLTMYDFMYMHYAYTIDTPYLML